MLRSLGLLDVLHEYDCGGSPRVVSVAPGVSSLFAISIPGPSLRPSLFTNTPFPEVSGHKLRGFQEKRRHVDALIGLKFAAYLAEVKLAVAGTPAVHHVDQLRPVDR